MASQKAHLLYHGFDADSAPVVSSVIPPNGTAHSTAQDMRPLMASFTYRSVDSVAMLFSGLGSSPPTPAFSRGAMMDVGSVVAGVCRWHNK